MFYLHKPNFFGKENRRVLVGGGDGGIILRILRAEFEYRVKAQKIKSIDFVNKPQRRERLQSSCFCDMTSFCPSPSPPTQNPSKRNIVWPAGRKMRNFVIHFKCLFCTRLLENKRKFPFKKGSYNLMTVMDKSSWQRHMRSVVFIRPRLARISGSCASREHTAFVTIF